MFKKAEKHGSKLRLAIFGPPGSGKTMTALRIAKGIGGNIAFIDSERGSASKYSDRFNFDVVNLEKKTVEEYTACIRAAAAEGYNVLVIDSLSHAWQELVEEIEILAGKKYNGNSFRAWGEGTPKQREFIDCILSYPGHVIGTMRSAIEYQVSVSEKNGKSSMKPEAIGLKPEQGKGIEYEFDLLIQINQKHYATIIKDRTGKYQDVEIEKPGEDFGKELVAWLNDGNTPEKDKQNADSIEQLSAKISSILISLVCTAEQQKAIAAGGESAKEALAFNKVLFGEKIKVWTTEKLKRTERSIKHLTADELKLVLEEAEVNLKKVSTN